MIPRLFSIAANIHYCYGLLYNTVNSTNIFAVVTLLKRIDARSLQRHKQEQMTQTMSITINRASFVHFPNRVQLFNLQPYQNKENKYDINFDEILRQMQLSNSIYVVNPQFTIH